MPHFPPQTFWKNHVSVVEKRKIELTDYLNNFCRHVDILRDDECCQFFGFDDVTRKYLIDIKTMNSKNTNQLKRSQAKSPPVFPRSSYVAPDIAKPFKQVQWEKMYRDDEVIAYFFRKTKNPDCR